MTTNRNVSGAEMDGAKGYTPLALRFYDVMLNHVNLPYFWECPSSELLTLYNNHVSENHLDVGVGTGYLLDKCRFASPSRRLYVFDLNANSLDVTAKRLARYRPQKLEGSVLSPVPYEGEPFDSIGVTNLIHCVPGSIPEKAVLFDHLGKHLRPGGVIFGSTVLGDTARMPRIGRRVFDAFNKKGVFHNRSDNETDLRNALEARFTDVSLRRVGSMGIFSARKRSETSTTT